ncbi:putative immune-responsive protein [Exophiala viscosa]|uniref:putative immune-responsive protein n=1 Tax=Exophiala viscosa TaxID=2486360 RepID=UPI00219AA659|nr:putative immune-responsive protein [Exophiala viscosa]
MSASSANQTATSLTEASNPPGVTGQLCTWIHDTTIDKIPADVLERAKYLILDGIACGLVAANLPWSETAARGIFDMEPEGQCTVIGYGGKKLSPIAATVLNSTFIQGFELDDYHSLAPLHSCSLLLPALFAAAEATSTSTQTFTGKDFLRAFVVGCETGPRVGLALHGADLLTRGWHSGSVQGPSATAAAVSSFLNLCPAHIESALGMACTQAGGLMSAQFGSMAKRMQHGFAARNGLFAALMAKEGYTGIEQVYEVPYGGFLDCFAQGATYEPKALPEELVSGLGERWELYGVRVKLHAAMAGLHGTIDCIANLQEEHPNLFEVENLQNIESITTQHSRPAFEHGGWVAPPDKPISSLAAQMSIQYVAAAQLVDHQVLMAQFGADKLNRPILRDIMAKTTPTHNAEFDKDKKTGWVNIATVRFKDGTEVTNRTESPRGIEPPASNEDVVTKWRMLVQDVLEIERREEIEKCVLGMDSLDDVRKLVKLLEGTVKCPITV